MKVIDIKGSIIANDYKWIYDWLGYQSTCPDDVTKALNDAAGDEIIIKINSPGGQISAASEIYTEIRDYKGKKTNKIYGMAASAAGVIATSCYCEMSPTALFMIHNVSTGGVSGDHKDMEHQAEILKTADKTIAAAFVAKTGMSENEVLEIMDKETWIDANRALELGIIDKIMFTEQQNVDFSNLSNVMNNSYINSVNVLNVPEDTIKQLMLNQQKNADFLKANEMKNKALATLNLLKLGGHTYE